MPVFLHLQTSEPPKGLVLGDCISALTFGDCLMSSVSLFCSADTMLEKLATLKKISQVMPQKVINLLLVWAICAGDELKNSPEAVEGILALIRELGGVEPNPWVVDLLDHLQGLNEQLNHLPLTKPMKSHARSAWNVVKPAVIADVITLCDYQLFRQIRIKELMVYGKTPEDQKPNTAPFMHAFVEQSNHWFFFALTHILSFRDPALRCQALAQVIAVAERCRKLNNISGVVNLGLCLLSTPICRLKQTWELLPERARKQADKLSQLASVQNNFGKLRAHHTKLSLPAIPHIGLVLQDVMMMAELPNYLSLDGVRTDLLNFHKARLVAKSVLSLTFFQQSRYDFHQSHVTEDLIDLVRWSRCPPFETLWNRSKEFEP